MLARHEDDPAIPLLDERRRLEALRSYGVLDTPRDEALDELAKLAAAICQAPIALISLVDERRQWFKAKIGLELPETPRDQSFCAHALHQANLLIVPDATMDVRFVGNPLVTGEPGIRFYAGAPLVTPDGAVLGTLCVIDRVPRALEPGQDQALRALGRQVMTQLDLHRQCQDAQAGAGKLRAIFDAEPECVKLLDRDGTLLEMNPAGLRLIEADSLEAVAGHSILPMVVPEDRDAVRAMLEAAARGEKSTLQFRCSGVKGTPRWLEMSGAPFHDEATGRDLILGISRDITARKLAEEKVARLNQLYAVSSRVNEAIVRIHDTPQLYERVCRIAVEEGGIVMAWVGLVEAGDAFLRPVAVHGKDEGYLSGIQISVLPGPLGVGPSGRAFREDRVVFCDDIASDPNLESWREKALLRGYRSTAAFPLRVGGRPVGVFTVYGDRTDFFHAVELQLLQTLAENISFAIETHRNEQERRRVEEALRFSEARFASIFRSNPAAIGINTLASGRIIEANERFCSFFGWSRAEIVGKTIFDLQIWADPAQREPLLAQVRATGTARDAEVQLRRRDGEVRDVLLSLERVEMPGETEPVLLGIFTDLTERKQAEEARRASEIRYRTLFDHAPDGILIADRESIYLDANASICRMLGYQREELIGLHAADIVAPTEVEHIATALRTLAADSDHHREWKLRRKDGSIFPAEVLATVMPDGNLLGMIRDVSERQRSEARFHRLVDSNVQGVMFWKAKGEISGANGAFLRIVGYTWDDLEAGRLNWNAMTPPEYSGADQQAAEEIAREGVCTPLEKELIRQDGSRVPVLVGAARFEDSPEEGVCFVLDLTERKKLEQQFLRAQRMESIGTLAGGIAHDLNNALAPIMMSLELLRMRLTDADSQHLLAIVSASAQRGADMVRQVLSFARGVEGRRLDVQVRHLVHDMEKMANETFLKHIEVRASTPPDLWMVSGDPTQLHQVLLNLCVNARDAMPHGGTLTISAANVTLDRQDGLDREAKPGPYVFLQVEDNGAGIAPEIIERIFDPFFTTKEVGRGTGLGLSTSLAIVKSHGGFLRVYSEPGRGSTFKVYLPAKVENSPVAVTKIEEEMPRGRGELILVVDDEAPVRKITQKILEAFGYRVLLAADGSEAVAIFAREKGNIAAVLTDMTMPVMDGPATIQVLQKLDPTVPIIAASGLASNGYVARAASLGVTHFLPKPYTAETLLKTLQKVLAAAP